MKIFSKRLRWPAGLLIKVLVVGRHYWYVYVVQTDIEIVACSPVTLTLGHSIFMFSRNLGLYLFLGSRLTRLDDPSLLSEGPTSLLVADY